MLRLGLLCIAGLMTLTAGLLALVLSIESAKQLEMYTGILMASVLIILGAVVGVDSARKMHYERKLRKEHGERWSGRWVSNFD